MAGEKPKKKTTGCCETETVIPRGIVEREEFCAVTSRGRKCTDAFCCLIFLFFLAAWAACFGIGMYFGEPLSLIYARDYKVGGSVGRCGWSVGAVGGWWVGRRRGGPLIPFFCTQSSTRRPFQLFGWSGRRALEPIRSTSSHVNNFGALCTSTRECF